MFLYVLVFIAGSRGSPSPASFSQGFYKEESCIVARDKIRKDADFKQVVECFKL